MTNPDDGVPYLCPACLSTGSLQRMWVESTTLNLVCPVHGPMATLQSAAAGLTPIDDPDEEGVE